MRYAEETLAKAAMALDENGYTAMAGIETMGKMNQLGTLDEVIRLCRVSTKHFRPVVDFGHINARTQGGLSSADDFKRIFDTIAEKLSPEHADSLHCHFSKIEYTAGGEKRHLTFADRVYGPEFEPLAEVIAADSLSPRIICESDGTMAEDALTMKRLTEEAASRLCPDR